MTLTTTAPTAAPYRPFSVTVGRVDRLAPSTLRFTLVGDELAHLADNGFDQRVKVVLPLADGSVALTQAECERTGLDWYSTWLALPPQRRNPLRTYTVRAARPAAREVVVDVVLHPGDDEALLGPAARWAAAAAVGDALGLVGPDAGWPDEQGGVEFAPPPGSGPLLLAGDETAVPAVGAILERLPATATGTALLEVPVAADSASLDDVTAPPGVEVRFLPREGAPRGDLLRPAVAAAAAGAAGAGAPPYAWLAGEAGVVAALRRDLVVGAGWDRRAVCFRGYWKAGQSEG